MAVTSRQWHPSWYLNRSDYGAQVRAMAAMDIDGNDYPRIRVQNNDTTGQIFSILMDSASPADNDLYTIGLEHINDNDQVFNAACFDVQALDVSDGSEDGRLRVYTMVGGTATEQFRIDSTSIFLSQLEVQQGASGGATAFVVDNNDIDQIAMVIEAANTTADVLDIEADSVTTVNVVDITADGLSTGKVINAQTTSTALAAGEIMTLDGTISGSSITAKTGNFSSVALSRTETRTSGTTADDFDLLGLTRTNIMNGAGGTLTSAGSVLRLQNVATQTAGTLTDSVNVLEIVQDADSTGNSVKITHPVNTGQAALDIDSDGNHASNDVVALAIDTDNSGAGDQVALNITMVDEAKSYFAKFANATTGWTSTKNPETDAEDGWLKIDVNGTAYFVPYYAAS